MLGTLSDELNFTAAERKVLLSTDDIEDGTSCSRHEAEMKMVKRATGGAATEERFDRFKEDFFRGIGKLNRMQTIAE